MKNILITGASGFVGNYLMKQAALKWRAAGVCRSGPAYVDRWENFIPLDITDKDRVFSAVEEAAPSVVIHCAAVTDAEYCAKNKDLAEEINIAGTENMALAARRAGARFIFVSSDQVFDGTDGYYNEDSVPNPISVYGRTKLEGEKLVREIDGGFTVARLAWIYGRGLGRSKNFLDSLVDNLKNGKRVTLFHDEFRSPVYVGDVCAALLALAERLAESKAPGIFHLAGPERISRLDFGYKAAEYFGLDKSLIDPASSDSIPFLNKRPKDCSLTVSRSAGPSVNFMTVADGLAAFAKSAGK